MFAGRDMQMKKQSKIPKYIYITVFVLLIITIPQVFYVDVKSNTRQGMLVWEALFSGRFFEYYRVSKEAKEAGLMIHFSNYDMVLNILMGLWQLPLYIAEKLIGCENIVSEYMAARIYSKLYLPIMVILSGHRMAQIGKEMGRSEEEQEQIFLLFISSIFVVSSAVVTAQVDAIGLYFFLSALYYVLKKDNLKFMLFFILAVQCKYFAFFFMVPVIIIKEKRIWKMMLESATPMVLNFVINLPFKLMTPAEISEKSERLETMVEEMLRTKIRIMEYSVPVLFISFTIVCIAAYFINPPKEENRWKKYVVYFSFLGMLALFLTMDIAMPYWHIYYTPFILLLFFSENGKRAERLLLETACTMSLAVGYFMQRWHCFTAFDIMIAGKLVKHTHYISLEDIYNKFGHESYYMAWTITVGLFVSYLLWGLVYHGICLYRNTSNDSVEIQPTNITKWIIPRAVLTFILCNIAIIFYILGR